MKQEVRQTYMMMGSSGIPVFMFTIAGLITFGTDTIPASIHQGYEAGLGFLFASFVVLGGCIGKFNSCLVTLRRQLGEKDFVNAMRTRVTPSLFFFLGIIIGALMTSVNGETNLYAVGELEAIRQLTVTALAIFVGVGACVAMRAQAQLQTGR